METGRERSGALAIVDDLVSELTGRRWAERRDLVDRIATIEQVALSLLEGKSVDGTVLTLTTQRKGIVREAVAEALDRLGVTHAVCADSAYVLSLSADQRHQTLAQDWFTANPDLQGPGPTLH